MLNGRHVFVFLGYIGSPSSVSLIFKTASGNVGSIDKGKITLLMLRLLLSKIQGEKGS